MELLGFVSQILYIIDYTILVTYEGPRITVEVPLIHFVLELMWNQAQWPIWCHFLQVLISTLLRSTSLMLQLCSYEFQYRFWIEIWAGNDSHSYKGVHLRISRCSCRYDPNGFYLTSCHIVLTKTVGIMLNKGGGGHFYVLELGMKIFHLSTLRRVFTVSFIFLIFFIKLKKFQFIFIFQKVYIKGVSKIGQKVFSTCLQVIFLLQSFWCGVSHWLF